MSDYYIPAYEADWLRDLSSYIKDKRINPRFQCILKDNNGNESGPFGSWITRMEMEFAAPYFPSLGKRRFRSNVSFEVSEKMKQLACVSDLFGPKLWSDHPAKIIDDVLSFYGRSKAASSG